jgi:hypothetical protein
MKKVITVVLCALMLSGCMVWRDSSGIRASMPDEFDCKQKCGMYQMGGNPLMNAFCERDCMESKGYTRQRR